MKFCSNCGTQIEDGVKYCPNCGSPVDNSEIKGFAYEQQYNQPYNVTPLKTDRSLIIMLLLSVVTCGIYWYIFVYQLAKDVNTACEGDGEETPGLLILILLSIITCGIYSFIWYYKLGNRLANNASRYGFSVTENGTTVLLWMLIGQLMCGIGPIIAWNIIINNTNLVCTGYNRSHGIGC